MRLNVLALENEPHEALAETGWKPWATSNHINVERFHGELVDAWHFFMNLMLHSGMTAETLTTLYYAKREINITRQNNGYTGVTEKCPGCKAAYDDPGVKCYPADDSPNTNRWAAWCATLGRSA